MKKLVLILLSYFSIQYYFSQSIDYSYDAHGNRTLRSLTFFAVGGSSRNLNTTNKKENNEQKKKGTLETMTMAMNYGVSIYPNPTEKDVDLVMNKVPENASVKIYLYDMNGKLIQETELKDPTKSTVAVETLNKGVHHLSVIINNKDELHYKIQKK